MRIGAEDKCFLCGSRSWLETHHIFNGPNRKKSTEYGLVVKLCHFCHNEPPNGIHHNKERRQYLQDLAQRQAMKVYGWSVDDFRRIFGKNYLIEEGENNE